MSTFRNFMVKNFVGLEGVKLATLGKDGKFKPARTISWMKGGIRIFVVFLLYGIEKILSRGEFIWWDAPFLLAIAFCIWAGFIYPRTNPLQPDEMNEVETEKRSK